MENPVYKDWDEFVNPDFILVHLNNGRKIKISKSNKKGGKLVYQSILRAFSDNNFAVTNKILDAIIKNLS